MIKCNRMLAPLALSMMLSTHANADQRVISWNQYMAAVNNGYWMILGTSGGAGAQWYYCVDISKSLGWAGDPRNYQIVVEMGRGQWVQFPCSRLKRTVPIDVRATPTISPPPPRNPPPLRRPGPAPRDCDIFGAPNCP